MKKCKKNKKSSFTLKEKLDELKEVDEKLARLSSKHSFTLEMRPFDDILDTLKQMQASFEESAKNSLVLKKELEEKAAEFAKRRAEREARSKVLESEAAEVRTRIEKLNQMQEDLMREMETQAENNPDLLGRINKLKDIVGSIKKGNLQ
jgi:chromosome segregation ATPase